MIFLRLICIVLNTLVALFCYYVFCSRNIKGTYNVNGEANIFEYIFIEMKKDKTFGIFSYVDNSYDYALSQ